jgi:DNA repair ATPase RecN
LEKLVLISKALDESSDFLLGITHFDKKLSKDTEYIEVMKSSMLRIEELIQEYSSKIENIKSSSDFIIKNSEHLEYNKQRFYEIRTEIISQLQEIPYVPVELINEYKEMTP